MTPREREGAESRVGAWELGESRTDTARRHKGRTGDTTRYVIARGTRSKGRARDTFCSVAASDDRMQQMDQLIYTLVPSQPAPRPGLLGNLNSQLNADKARVGNLVAWDGGALGLVGVGMNRRRGRDQGESKGAC